MTQFTMFSFYVYMKLHECSQHVQLYMFTSYYMSKMVIQHVLYLYMILHEQNGHSKLIPYLQNGTNILGKQGKS